MTDEEWFYNMCGRMNKMPIEAQLETFLEEVKDNFVIAMRL